MPRIATFVLVGWLSTVFSNRALAVEEFAFFHENVIGTSLALHVRADDRRAAAGAEDRVLWEIDRLSSIFSSYDRTSEFSRWQAQVKGAARVSPELFGLLQACDLWRSRSGGAFDPRVEVLSHVWSQAAKRDRLPTAEDLAKARALMNRPAWCLDPDQSTAERLSECPLSLNAIAKGYIVERACDEALKHSRGVHGLLLNVGGDLRVWGEFEKTITIVSPLADSESSEPLVSIMVKDRAVATSGRSQRGFQIKGRWYSHIFDPRIGLPADQVESATVIAKCSADADALATILNVLAPEEGLRLVSSLADTECLIVGRSGELFRSPGWHHYERPSSEPPALSAKENPPKNEARGTWNPDFELVVHFEINQPNAEGGRYRRPYVVVWVEDKNGIPIRTLLLFVSQTGAGPDQWLPDLKRWYRGEEARRMTDTIDLVRTMARPTRPPGKYSVTWDGKDNHGRLLDRGEYTVSIDAAREHGTYQGIHRQVNLADKPFAEELKGNVEIRSASIEYRRKSQAK
jgi:thiamine biosynthesis lipoprotein ApbE